MERKCCILHRVTPPWCPKGLSRPPKSWSRGLKSLLTTEGQKIPPWRWPWASVGGADPGLEGGRNSDMRVMMTGSLIVGKSGRQLFDCWGVSGAVIVPTWHRHEWQKSLECVHLKYYFGRERSVLLGLRYQSNTTTDFSLKSSLKTPWNTLFYT